MSNYCYLMLILFTIHIKTSELLYPILSLSEQLSQIYDELLITTDINKELIKSIKENNISRMRYLIERGANVKIPGLINISNNMPVITYLLEHGADPNSEENPAADEPNYVTPLISAIQTNNKELIDLLIKAGADINRSVDKVSTTPLITSILHKNINLAFYLIQHNADLNMQGDPMRTPFLEALQINNEELINMLMFFSYKLDEKTAFQVLSKILDDNNMQLFHKLLQHGIPINSTKGRSILLEAMRQRKTDFVDALLKAGANIKATDHIGYGILSYATGQNDRLPYIKYLVSLGADVNAKNVLRNTIETNQPDVARYLLEAGTNPNSIDTYGYSALQIAANNNYEITRILINAGADVNQTISHTLKSVAPYLQELKEHALKNPEDLHKMLDNSPFFMDKTLLDLITYDLTNQRMLHVQEWEKWLFSKQKKYTKPAQIFAQALAQCIGTQEKMKNIFHTLIQILGKSKVREIIKELKSLNPIRADIFLDILLQPFSQTSIPSSFKDITITHTT